MAWVIGDLRTAAAMTVVPVEPHAELALEFAPRRIVMDCGRVVYDGPSAELARDRQRLQSLVGVAR
jgi:branched-chain amino acid transport system ATP-binding protein